MPDGPDGADDPIEMPIVLMLNSGRRRLWLTAGYFVPHEPLLTALQLARPEEWMCEYSFQRRRITRCW
jgi:cardiolipin synthase